MLKPSVFKSIRTLDELKSRLKLLQSVSKEKCIPFNGLLKVDSDEYDDMTYIFSCSKGDIIYKHFFSYEDNETGLIGICEINGGSDKIHRLLSPNYVSYISCHPNVWIGVRQDTYHDVIINKKIVLDDVDRYDTITLCEELEFIQLDKDDCRYLICLDHIDIKSGFYCPCSKEDFDKWFSSIITKKGYEGRLDSVPISEIFGIYFEIVNCIFDVGNFKSISMED